MEWFDTQAALDEIESEIAKRRALPGGKAMVQIPQWEADSINVIPCIFQKHLRRAFDARLAYTDARIVGLVQRIAALERKI